MFFIIYLTVYPQINKAGRTWIVWVYCASTQEVI